MGPENPDRDVVDARSDPAEIERSAVLLRAVLSLLIALTVSVLNSLLVLLVGFQLAYTFVTGSLPSDRVQELGNRVSAYYVQLLRYATHNDSTVPFPFSDLPEPAEPGGPAYAPASSEARQPADDTREA